jgi:heterodisulfide reductase subunit A
VRLATTVTSLEPVDGGFRPVLESQGTAPGEVHGALIVATGAEEHHPAGSVGRTDGSVLTQAELSAALAAGNGGRGKVVMVQCVGSRNDEHPHCSRTCCADALRNALRLRQEDPASEVTVLHRGIRVWGFDEELLSEAIESGVEFVEVDGATEVVSEPGLTVSATGADGNRVTVEPDLVVLSTGVEPSARTARLAEALGVGLCTDGFFERAGRVATGRSAPVAYACGRACGPADLHERILQARAVAGKACLYLKRGHDEAQ